MMRSIGGYPLHLTGVVRLADGTRVTLRPVLPEDGELHRRFFRSLSPRSRYCRFMSRLTELPEPLVERFTDVDYTSHLALLATISQCGAEVMIGEARCVAERDDPDRAEFAIAVADAWQRQGIALALMERLERQAAASGFRQLVADTLVSNGPMLGLAQRAGYAITANPEDRELARLQKQLQPVPAVAA
jgi:acetyltransferase